MAIILGPKIAKLHAELDSFRQKTSKTTCCTTFCAFYLRSDFSKMPSGGHLGFMQISGVVQGCLSGNQARLVLKHL